MDGEPCESDWAMRKAEILRLAAEIRKNLSAAQLDSLERHDWLFDEPSGNFSHTDIRSALDVP